MSKPDDFLSFDSGIIHSWCHLELGILNFEGLDFVRLPIQFRWHHFATLFARVRLSHSFHSAGDSRIRYFEQPRAQENIQ